MPSTDGWIQKQWYTYTVKYYSAMRKKKILLFVTAWIKLDSIRLSKISQSEKEKCHMILLIVESKEQNKPTKKKQTHRYRYQTDVCHMGGGMGVWVKR